MPITSCSTLAQSFISLHCLHLNLHLDKITSSLSCSLTRGTFQLTCSSLLFTVISTPSAARWRFLLGLLWSPGFLNVACMALGLDSHSASQATSSPHSHPLLHNTFLCFRTLPAQSMSLCLTSLCCWTWNVFLVCLINTHSSDPSRTSGEAHYSHLSLRAFPLTCTTSMSASIIWHFSSIS